MNEIKKVSEDKIDQSSLSINILNEWPLSARTYNALKAENIFFVGDLLLLDENSLLKLRNFGRKSLVELHYLLIKYKISNDKNLLNLSEWEETREQLIIELEEKKKQNFENKNNLIGLYKSIFKDSNKYKENFYNLKKIIINLETKPTELEKIIIEDIEYILSLLTDRMLIFFKGRYGYEENYKTLDELGKKYQITRERVRQLEQKLNLSLAKLGQIDKQSLIQFFKKYEYISFHKLFPILDKKFANTTRATEKISGNKLTSFMENFCGVKKKYFKTSVIRA